MVGRCLQVILSPQIARCFPLRHARFTSIIHCSKQHATSLDISVFHPLLLWSRCRAFAKISQSNCVRSPMSKRLTCGLWPNTFWLWVNNFFINFSTSKLYVRLTRNASHKRFHQVFVFWSSNYQVPSTWSMVEMSIVVWLYLFAHIVFLSGHTKRRRKEETLPNLSSVGYERNPKIGQIVHIWLLLQSLDFDEEEHRFTLRDHKFCGGHHALDRGAIRWVGMDVEEYERRSGETHRFSNRDERRMLIIDDMANEILIF